MKRLRIMIWLLVPLVTGCAGDSGEIFGFNESVVFEVGLSATEGRPGAPIKATAVVVNRGRTQIFHHVSCVAESFVFTVVGPAGPIEYSDPCIPIPLCAGSITAMEHRQSTRGAITFDGTIYDRARDPDAPCMPYAAMAGDYTVVARFSYAPADRPNEWRQLERTATFRWSP